jgi:hypothetical protein
MRALLLPCPACLRHVRVNSGQCPFCDKELPRSFGTSAAFFQPRRTTRAGVYSHTAAASLLAAAACGGLIGGSNVDAGDATAPDGGTGDASSGHEDAAIRLVDGGADVLDEEDAALDAAPCDSGPRQTLDAAACGALDAYCPFFEGECQLFECHVMCPPAPPYGKAFIED